MTVHAEIELSFHTIHLLIVVLLCTRSTVLYRVYLRKFDCYNQPRSKMTDMKISDSSTPASSFETDFVRTEENPILPDDKTRNVGTQAGSAVLKEDSNIVTIKSWSDDEEDGDSDQVKRGMTLTETVNCETEPFLDLNGGTNVFSEGKRKAEDTSESSAKRLKSSENEISYKSSVNSQRHNRVEGKRKNLRFEESEDRFNETSYYFQNGLRKVYPYDYTFKTFTKGRWVGRKILDVFSTEFRAHNGEEYERCLKAGSLTVNGEKVECDYILKHNDVVANTVHRHEVPVTAEPIEIVHIDRDIVVVNKPSSIPVHPCGRYRHNTVVFILAKEYNLKNLRTVHRLDRLTSGVLMFSRTAKRASEIESQIRSRDVSKQYICRVEGEFPNGEIECNEPIEVVSYKIGVCKVSAKGKDCSTIFKKLGYNKKTNSSVVYCKPHTGRMHQIRVHLQYLGFPIIRDPLYNHPVFGPDKGKNGNIGKSDQELIQELIELHNAESWLGDGDVGVGLKIDASPNVVDEEKATDLINVASKTLEFKPERNKNVACQTCYDEPDNCLNPSKIKRNLFCSECKINYRDPKPSDLTMYLHALSYEGPNWAYKTKLPAWADIDWEENF